MNKKKILWYSFMLIIFVLAIYIIIPYVFSSRNLISKNYDNCTYEEICILDSNSTEYSAEIKNNKEGKVDKLVKLIDGLTIKKIWKPKDLSTYGISFVATYKKEEGNTCTEEAFFIQFYKDNVIGFKKKSKKEIYYKIQDEEFNIKEVIDSLDK